MPHFARKQLDAPSLFAAALLVAVGGLIYELILGTAASYLFGDSIVSFSIATGVTLFGMGLGSLLSAKLIKRAALSFVWNEIALGVIGGFSVLLLFAAFSMYQLHWQMFILLSLAIGTLIGLEIPLLVSLFKQHGKASTVKLLGRVLALDYFGALIASLLFPFLLLPYLGLNRAAIMVALLNIAVALFILWRMGMPRVPTTAAIVAIAMLAGTFVYATQLEQAIDARAFRDPVVLTQASQYQRIVVTQFDDDTRLYLNNQLQFSSRDEARYHETLVHAAMTSASRHQRVAILGGGDGLAAREVLKYRDVEMVTVIDIDPMITTIAKDNPLLSSINKHSLSDKRVQVRNDDAMISMQQSHQPYDVIIADFVDPANERIAKLYSTEFYRDVRKNLQPDGVFITQASSSYFTPNAYTIIANTIDSAFAARQTVPLSINVPSFGEWGFVVNLPTEKALFHQTALPSGLAYLTDSRLQRTRQDAVTTKDTSVSSLLHPHVYTTYQQDMAAWRY